MQADDVHCDYSVTSCLMYKVDSFCITSFEFFMKSEYALANGCKQ